MNLKLQVRSAIMNLLSAKLRSILALLGILVGTASVVAMVSGGELATAQALKQFKSLGTNLLAISVNSQSNNEASLLRNKLSYKKVNRLKSISKDILDIAPYATAYTNISFASQKFDDGVVIGTTEDLANIMHLSQMKGRFISYLDNYASYCVLGQNIYQKIKKQNPSKIIGNQIKIGSDIFTIVGVIKHWPQNSFIYADLNDAVFIPVAASFLLNKYVDINNIVMRINPNTNIPKLEGNIKDFFHRHTRDKQLYFRSAAQLINSMKKQKQIFTVFLGFIGGISLLVGGIGVMNIMLVSVTERRREIGIRLAVGAKRRDIQSLFLVEAIILALLGGILGIILGELISFIIATSRHWGFEFFYNPSLVGFSVSVFVGIFFGFYPAYKASKLDPIETLRTE